MEQTPSGTCASKDLSIPLKGRQRGRPRKINPTEVDNEISLSYEHQLFIVSHIAIHTPYAELRKLVMEKYGKDISLNQVAYYRQAPAWQPKVQKFREEYEAKVSDEPLSSKRNRVKELSRTYAIMRDSGELRDSVVVLDKIREEVEGKSSGQTNITQYNQYNSLSDEELRKVIHENNRFLEIHQKRQEALAPNNVQQIDVNPQE